MTFWVAGAAIVGSIGGAAIGAHQTGKAVEAQSASVDKANESALVAQREAQAFQQKQVDQARADQEPWRLVGADAVNKLAKAPDFAYTGANLTSDPGYQFGLSEGMKGLTSSAAARGALLSGAALKASTRYAQDYAGTKFNEGFGRALQTDNTNKNRLASLAGVGQIAAGQNGTNAMQLGQTVGSGLMSTAGQIGNNLMGAGNARASGYLAQGNALTGALNQGLSAWGQYRSGNQGNYGAGNFGDYFRAQPGESNFIGPTQG